MTFPTIQNRFFGPGVSLVARLTHTISPTLLNDIVDQLREFGHHFDRPERTGWR